MNTNNRSLIALGITLGLVGLTLATGASADPNTNFATPPFYGQTGTTYQEWDGYSTASGANTPTYSTNSAGTATWTDTTVATDGAFLIGTAPSAHIYSFSGVLHPEIVVPGLSKGAAYTTTLVLQFETQGNPIATTSVTVTPAGGTALASTSSSVTTTTLTGGMGGEDDVYLFTWSNLPGSVAGYTFDFSTGNTSVSQVGTRVDTLTTLAAAPEPGQTAAFGIGLAGLGALALRARRRVA